MQIERRKPLTARVGLVAVGHHTYWDQFEGLLDDLMSKFGVLKDRVTECGVEVEAFGMVDQAEGAYAALPRIKGANLDLLFVDMVTYATSSTWGVLVRDLDIPIVLVALQPLKAMDYAHGSTYMQLCNDDFCSVPEFTGVALRMGRPVPPVILGTLYDDPVADAEIAEWCQIAKVLHDLKTARLGLMGHVLEAMLDMHTDPAAVTRAFGSHVVLCEPDDILKQYRDVSDPQAQAKAREILAFFDTPDPVSDPLTSKLSDADLDMAARVAVALEAFIEQKGLDGLAYYYEAEEGSEMRRVVTNLIVGNSLLTGAGFPMCGEFDVKTCVAMMIMDRLDIGGSFAEFHPIDFVRDSVLVGHDGPHHINIAEGKPVLRSLAKYHGKPGSGASVEFQIKEGPITMLSIGVKANGEFKFVLAEGESLRGPIPPTGNTNTHGTFRPDVRTFLKNWVAEGPTHHFALGIGHHADTIAKVAECLGIEAVNVTAGLV
ncbi:MAG: L-fucose/L-arabinose isomerase family protein [Lentisphaerae bacterium]|jgi:L-arabinose isomerase|nr:L-fucose/L-arabinose isomerase family protein [Lentisphaerota bacterium]MBT4819894.1 L-fucose/L-arabinose isomerase family protein [Lentisphaerota bacterium]MBT5608185.1 L-fucose/L-arabinose isomerase family protein [Lentisphaerota bacterium]MBT7058926.1 L-fucose/L-arabinose isomerase family protein [Lentisphaerota bacterium]MBT7842843.1 L-fucose/L-arabinose isomerase family protein [Lentisphaerota bacterium]